MADTGALQKLIDMYVALPEDQKAAVEALATKVSSGMVWVPNPGPQSEAYLSPADEVGYGGEAGGGKSALIVGLSLTDHWRSLVLRRTNTEARKFIIEYTEILGSRDGWNSQNGEWRLPGGRSIEIGGCQLEDDKQKRKGHPHDLIGFDEVQDFTETQYTFIIGWNRSTRTGQRCRVVATFNPPTRPEGLWIIKRWGAWLDPRHPRPAKPGELRWYTTINGEDTEVDGPGPHEVEGEMIKARSRTFIRATLSDNPDLAKTDYAATLAAMPADLRAAYKGGRFDESIRDDPHQIIPTAWIREAQIRWTPQPPIGVPMCAMSIDPSGGGRDPMVLGWRHDGWFAPFIVTPGRELPMDMMGRYTAGHVIQYRRDMALVVIDLGGGYGSAAFEHMRQNSIECIGWKGGEASGGRTRDRKLGFHNKRTQALWQFRESLDPDQAGGSQIFLPDDPELVADLSAPTFWVDGSMIHAETKEDVVERLGRSTDKGDCTVMGWQCGATASTDGSKWDQQRRKVMYPAGNRPQVLVGRHHQKRR